MVSEVGGEGEERGGSAFSLSDQGVPLGVMMGDNDCEMMMYDAEVSERESEDERGE